MQKNEIICINLQTYEIKKRKLPENIKKIKINSEEGQ